MTGWGPGRRVAAVGLPALALIGLGLAVTAPKRERVDPATPPAAAAAPLAAAPAPVPEPSADPAPAFDVVRVEPGRSAVVAGTAAPGASVTVYADAAPLAEVKADAEGNFVAIFDAPSAGAPQALTLEARTGDTVATSGEVVLLLPPAPPAARASDPGGAEPKGPAGSRAADPVPAVPDVAATAIVRADAVEVVPAVVGPVADRDVTLGSISYVEAGAVTLAGLGTAGSALRAYVDGTLAHEARVGADGRWRMDLGDVAEGLYTLRIDQLDAEGQVASRVETPFQRDYPRAPLPRPGAPSPTDATGVLTVQPGHNLWTLARLHYGSGVLYSQIFTANQELIRDPNLIYPGQVLDLPELGRSE